MKIEERFHEAEDKTCTEHDEPNYEEGGHHNPAQKQQSPHVKLLVLLAVMQ